MTSDAPSPFTLTPEQKEAAAKPRPEAAPNEVRLWGHSTILYWWVVWVYGYICAAITHLYGRTFDPEISDGVEPILTKVHANPWLGSSFLLLVLFIIIFSAVRVKGYIVLIAAMALIILALTADKFGIKPTRIFEFELPPVYMSFGFYIVISTVLLFFWFVAVFIMDRASYWLFKPRTAEQINFHFVDNQSFPTLMMQVRARPVDFLRKVLGLGLARDIVLSFNTGGSKVEFAIPNAWNVDRKLRQIHAMNASRQGA